MRIGYCFDTSMKLIPLNIPCYTDYKSAVPPVTSKHLGHVEYSPLTDLSFNISNRAGVVDNRTVFFLIIPGISSVQVAIPSSSKSTLVLILTHSPLLLLFFLLLRFLRKQLILPNFVFLRGTSVDETFRLQREIS